MYNLFSAQLKITVQMIQNKSVCSLLHNIFSAQFKIEMFALQIFLSEDRMQNFFIVKIMARFKIKLVLFFNGFKHKLDYCLY
jgi:hypothetical protein